MPIGHGHMRAGRFHENMNPHKKENSSNKIIEIPLPNMVEQEEKPNHNRHHKSKNPLSFITDKLFDKKFEIDDIILIGLIILIIDEGMENNFLLMILTYLLLDI